MRLRLATVFGSATYVRAPVPGRRGFGVPPGGAWDPVAWVTANALLGNQALDVGLELALATLQAELEQEGWVVLAGLGHSWSIDGRELHLGKAVWAREGSVLEVKPGGRGCRAVLAAPGGWTSNGPVAPGLVLASRTRRLAASLRDLGACQRPLPQSTLTWAGAGPELAGLRASRLMDRTGIRLEGSQASGLGGLSSRPVTVGAVQMTPDGTLIVVGPDGPTLGGYEVCGFLSVPSCADVAQLAPGDECSVVPSELATCGETTARWWAWLTAEHERISSLARRA